MGNIGFCSKELLEIHERFGNHVVRISAGSTPADRGHEKRGGFVPWKPDDPVGAGTELPSAQYSHRDAEKGGARYFYSNKSWFEDQFSGKLLYEEVDSASFSRGNLDVLLHCLSETQCLRNEELRIPAAVDGRFAQKVADEEQQSVPYTFYLALNDSYFSD